jgi:FkbM family methyltransferase
VEPQSRLIPIIASNVQLNQLMSVHIEQVALSEREGKLEIFLRPSTNTGASSMYRYWNFGRTSENVLQTTLDQLLQRYQIDHVRFLKCDCEGAEYLVVRGGSEAFKQQRFDFIGMEYHPHICGAEHCTETHTFLSNVGYVLCDVQGFTLYHLPQFADEVGELINERQYPGLSKP